MNTVTLRKWLFRVAVAALMTGLAALFAGIILVAIPLTRRLLVAGLAEWMLGGRLESLAVDLDIQPGLRWIFTTLVALPVGFGLARMVVAREFNMALRGLALAMGTLLLLGLVVWWNTRHFNFDAQGRPLVYLSFQRGGVHKSYSPGIDRVTGRSKVQATMDRIQWLSALATQSVREVDPAVETVWFDPNSGEPNLWFVETGSSHWQFFNRPHFHRSTGQEARPVTPEIMGCWKREHDRLVAEAKQARLAREAAEQAAALTSRKEREERELGEQRRLADLRVREEAAARAKAEYEAKVKRELAIRAEAEARVRQEAEERRAAERRAEAAAAARARAEAEQREMAGRERQAKERRAALEAAARIEAERMRMARIAERLAREAALPAPSLEFLRIPQMLLQVAPRLSAEEFVADTFTNEFFLHRFRLTGKVARLDRAGSRIIFEPVVVGRLRCTLEAGVTSETLKEARVGREFVLAGVVIGLQISNETFLLDGLQMHPCTLALGSGTSVNPAPVQPRISSRPAAQPGAEIVPQGEQSLRFVHSQAAPFSPGAGHALSSPSVWPMAPVRWVPPPPGVILASPPAPLAAFSPVTVAPREVISGVMPGRAVVVRGRH
jgi:hypothetical protein